MQYLDTHKKEKSYHASTYTKMGNSLGLRIPMQLAKQLKLHEGCPITLEIENGRMMIQSPKYNLDRMLDNITPKNQHHQILDDE